MDSTPVLPKTETSAENSEFAKSLAELREAVYSHKPVLRRIASRFGSMPILEYAREYAKAKVYSRARQAVFIEVFKEDAKHRKIELG